MTMAETLLELTDSIVSFDGFYALTDLSSQLIKGRVQVESLGPHGGGNDVSRCITGKVRPTKEQ